MTPTADYPCPCCGHLVFTEPPGSLERCPICGWDDDLGQLRFVHLRGGGNRHSLHEAQRHFAAFGASDPYAGRPVRPPGPRDRRDPAWRPIDETVDVTEQAVVGMDYGETFPADETVLYYWRPTYWRRDAR